MSMDRIPRSAIEKAKKLTHDFFKDESSEGKNPPSSEDLEKNVRAAITAGVLAAASLPNAAHASETNGITQHEQIEEGVLTEHEIDVLARNVYHEARGESLPGQLAVAQVALARLASEKFDRKDKGLMDGVIFAQNQFSWTNDPKVLLGLNEIDEDSLADIRAVLSQSVGGRSVKEAVLGLAENTGLPPETHYYKRSDWDENDPEKTEMSEKTKKFFRSLTKVGTIGSHTFYREKTPAEKENDATTESP